MGKYDKLLLKILRGASDASISFVDLCSLMKHLGFEERIHGSHHIFTKSQVEEILNLQAKRGKAKAYQIKQVRNIILKYRLGGKEDDQI
jgi:predicted RNA binding protein YcfA (HicA-like mRNA interferase family)